MEHESFLRAIIARPDDDLPRLVFADWLDENATQSHWDDIHRHDSIGVRPGNGYAERAEFIRVQCELARIAKAGWQWSERYERYYDSATASYPALPKNFDALRRRERELLPSMQWQFVKSFPIVQLQVAFDPRRHPKPIVFRRGFVEELTCSWSDCWAHLSSIREWTPVRKVRLTAELSDVVIQLHGFDGSLWPGIEFELPPHHG